jgi:uncharacterized protein (DUF433 family)
MMLITTLAELAFDRWRSGLVTDVKIMGGETVFPNSRLTVRRIGLLLQNGESIAAIKEDYPYLSDDDLDFSLRYLKQFCQQDTLSA